MIVAALLTDVGHRLWYLDELDWISTLLRLHDDQIDLGFYDPVNLFCGIEGTRWESIQEMEAASAEPAQPNTPRIFMGEACRLSWWQPLPLFTETMIRGRSWRLAVWLLVNANTYVPPIIRDNGRQSPLRRSRK